MTPGVLFALRLTHSMQRAQYVLAWMWNGLQCWSIGGAEKRNNRRESQARERTLPYWVAVLIQQQTDPKKDHLSPLWSPYKSSTFPLFSSAAHKLIKLAFPCCSWPKEWERHPAGCVVGGRGVYESMHTDPHTYSILFSFSEVDHKLLFLPEWYMCSLSLQLNKCCSAGMSALPMRPFFWFWGQWEVYVPVPHVSVFSVMESLNCLITRK